MAALTAPRPLRVAGSIRVPGDKSISHRALLLAALAEGESRVRDILPSADVQSTAGALRAMGVEVPELSPDFVVRGHGRLRAPAASLDCGNSGTTTRLLAGVVAGSGFSARFTGDASLSRRPMRRVQRPLEAMGARLEVEGERGDGLPMTVHGAPLHGIDWVSDTASAQVKSAILLAGVAAGVEVSVAEPARSRDHTERMLAARGARVEVDGLLVRLRGDARPLAPLDTTVPGDPSSAAFFAALAALANEGELLLTNVCVNPTRAGFLEVLRWMGAGVEEMDRRDEGGEPVATIRVRASGDLLRGAAVGGDVIPTMIDELPLLACLATRAAGETEIRDAAELRVKESDRITAVVDNLRAIGAEAEELPDGMRITGTRALLCGRVRTHGDHRLAMAFGILGALPGNEIEIDDPACVAVSYPGFWDDLKRVIA
ncbi:MAG TPA: 3-phosphoshikimate 1-carboxyvinyltransferase [Gemmatimonadaceae bacterium]